ncbi:MAG TPA: ABC transporter permease [Mycobacteriales bacterium]|nr:ABC transporter permease [Mycobacteriales bacterium]
MIGLVARREIQQRLRGRTFRVATGVMLLAIAVSIVIPTLRNGSEDHERVGLFHFGGARARIAVVAAGTQIGSAVDLIDERTPAAGAADLRSGQVDILLVGHNHVLVDHALRDRDTSKKAQLARALALLLGEEQAFAAAHLTPTQAEAVSHIEPLPVVGVSSAASTGSEQGTAVIGLVLLFILLSQYGTWTLIGVMEEKASRVVEVLLAAVRPTQLLAGKVIGIGALVFAQASILVGFALGLGAAVGSEVLKGTAPAEVVATLGWLLLGYAFYSWVFAAAGSMVERQDQIQAIAFPITIPLFVGYVSCVAAIGGNHASGFVTALAYIPLTAPFAMPTLVALHAVTWWGFLISALTTIVATFGMASFAGTVYRRAVLRTGRRVHLREVLSRAPSQSPG